jgi:predicted tellurium resistance membrane protein TerC
VKFSLAFILAFVGVKMLIEGLGVHISSGVSLGVIIGALAAGVGTSIILSKEEPPAPAPGATPE